MGKKWDRTLEILEIIWRTITSVFFMYLLVIAIGVLFRTCSEEFKNIGRVELHTNVFIGFVSMFVLLVIPRVRHNVKWLMTFTHEFIHMFFAIAFFRKIGRFNVDSKDSHVSFSGGTIGYMTITLSPYCFPLYTLILLPWRYTTATADPFMAIIDFLIGLTFAFHVCCWVRQTRLSQTDIIGPGRFRSMLVIVTVWLMALSLVLLIPGSGVSLTLQRAFVDYPNDTINYLVQLISQWLQWMM